MSPLRASAFLFVLGVAAGAVAEEPAAGAACGAPVCVRKPVKKEVKKSVYSEKCVPYCQSTCCCLRCLCGKGPCELRYKRVLMKQQVTFEKCETQCVLEHVPVCAPACVEPGGAEGGSPAPAAPDGPHPPTRAPRTPGTHPPDRAY